MNKKSIYAVVIAALALFTGTKVNAQQCLNDDHYFEHLEQNDPAAFARMIQANEIWEQSKDQPVVAGKNVYRIPVVFHIIHEYGPENISKEQILDQLRVINEDFRRMNADANKTRTVFQGVAADSEIEFYMARRDPSGNCTDGIVRVASPLTNDARDNVKAVSYWPSDRYLNIWVVKTIQNSVDDPGVITLGYAQFPWDRSSRPTTDGIVLRADYTGSIGTAANKNNGGRTATHEIGHWLGLFHTFQGGCFPPSWGEQIGDTPPVANSNSGCSHSMNSCTNDNPDLPDQVENYMDYSNGTCQNMFTLGQKARMHSMLTSYRSLIYSSANHTFTGIDLTSSVCAPKADIHPEKRVVCVGVDVTFSDISWNGPVTNRTWTFEGGTPSVSNAENPTVRYSQPGVYKVTFQAGNAAGNTQITRDSLIYVREPNQGGFIDEKFQSSTFPPRNWFLESQTNVKWVSYTGAGSNDNMSTRVVIGSSTPAGEITSLITPLLDLQAIGAPVLTFDVAYAKSTLTSLERFRVYVSIDCGQSWVQVFYRAGVQMETGPVGSTNFVPTSSQWAKHSVDLNNYTNNKDILIKFELTTDQGSNFYLDNINLTTANSVKEQVNIPGLQLYPNPAQKEVQVQFENPEEGNLTIKIMDLTGKLVQQVPAQLVGEGTQIISIDINELPSGTYFLESEINGRKSVRKMVVSN